MKKVLILNTVDIENLTKNFDPSRRFVSVEKILNLEPLKNSDFIFFQYNKNHFLVLKEDHPNFNIGFYIHKTNILDFIAGKKVKLYNNKEIKRLHRKTNIITSSKLIEKPCQKIINAIFGITLEE